jgi:cytochrome o ubiquinol oxidase subunit 2
MPTGKLARTLFTGAALGGLALVLGGCGSDSASILRPNGTIGLIERNILFRAFWIMMIVVIPVFVMTAWFAWRYRASDTNARYDPNWMSAKVDAIVWVIPALIVLSLGIHVWMFTHQLDPYKAIEPAAEPLRVEVVAQDWKWLFVYPDEGIAAVNELAFPSDKPLSLKITSDTVMNSFFIPGLGGQIYAMAGMQTQLNLLAEEPGRFLGRNTQYSGAGFPDQTFEAIAMSDADFEAWVEKVKQSGGALDAEAYDELAKPSIAHPVVYYATVESGLFGRIIARYDSAMVGAAMASE